MFRRGFKGLWLVVALMLVAGLVVFVAERELGPTDSSGDSALAAAAPAQLEAPAVLPGSRGPASAADAAVVLAGGESPPTTEAMSGTLDGALAVGGPEGVASSSDVLSSVEEPLPEQRGWVSLLAESTPIDPVSSTGGIVEADPPEFSVTPVYWSVGRVSLLDADGLAVGGSDDEDSSPVTVELIAEGGVDVSASVSPVVVLDVVDSDTAAEAGFQKVAFTVTVDGAGGLSTVDDLTSAESAELIGGVDARLTVDYGEFVDEFGGNWAGRLRLVSFEPCALTRERSDCPGVDVVDGFVNDVANEQLSVQMPLGDLVGAREGRSADSKSGTESGFALLAGEDSSSGDYATTSLNPSGSWAVGTQSGGFTWSYPIGAAAPPAGSAPGLSVMYSAGSIDGLTSDQNTQGGVLGPGWSFSDGFIERQYKGCGLDGGAGADFCWFTDNATFSFAGMNSRLIRVATESDTAQGYRPTVFRLESHSGWVVRRFAKVGASGRGAVGVDNDSEYWVATAPDGVQYWFGYGKERTDDGNPATTLGSVQTVPVVGNHSGEPCNGLSNNWCHQAYRWSLDRIEDPNGRVASFFYTQETNYYGIRGTPSWSEPYVSAAILARVEYGQLAASADLAAKYSHALTFSYQYRCNNPPTGGSCQTAPTTSTGTAFPDIPVDQLCGDTSCTNYAPTFFHRRMLTYATAMVRDIDGTMVNVSQDIFTYRWVDPDGTAANSDPARLWLNTIQHHGLRGGDSYMPPIRFFESPALGNRVDHDVAGGVTQMLYYRVGSIIDEYGAQLNVAYTLTKVCPNDIGDGTPPSGWGGWNDNTWSCFARYWAPPSGPAGWSAWHKYVVDSVSVIDQSGDQAATSRYFDYQYPQTSSTSGGMAWHSDDNPFIRVADRGWSEFRGFEQVRVLAGQVDEANRVLTDYTFHRGMSGDIDEHSNPVPGPTVSTPSTLGGVTDVDQLAGMERESIVRDVNANGTAGTAVFSATVTDYESSSTDVGYGVSWQVEVKRTRSRSSYNSVTRYGRVDYTYDTHPWMRRLIQVSDLGRVDGSTTAYGNIAGDNGYGDDSCAETSYSPAGGRFVNGLPWRQHAYGIWTCGDDAYRLSDVRSYFDNSLIPTASSALSPPTAPTAGNLTAVWRRTGDGVVDEACACAPIGVFERIVYGNNGYHSSAPSWGRVSSTIDARGIWTSVAYTPFSGTVAAFGAQYVTVTNTLGHESVTEFDLYGNQIHAIDPNDRDTWVCYDPLGRVTAAYAPNVSGGSDCSGVPSQTYVYDRILVDPNQSTPGDVDVYRWAIQSRELFTANGDTSNPMAGVDTYVESWTLFDGFGRVAQTNTPSPIGGRTVVRTRYDSHDNPVRISAPFHDTVPSSRDWSVFTDSQIPRDTYTTFDELGRPLVVEQLDNNWSIYTTSNTYSPASVAMWVRRDSAGANVYGRTLNYLDADGNTWRVAEEQNAGVTSETDYRYDQAGRLLSITDHADNVTTMTYNLLGWRTSLDDPDGGYSETNFYPTGQVRYTIDARNQTLYTRIDALGRPIAVYSSTTYSDANKLQAFNWDGTWQQMTGVIGLLTTADSYQASGAPNVETRTRITAVDSAGRPTSVEYWYPTADGTGTADDELGEPHTVTTNYTRNGTVVEQIYPGMPGSNHTTNETVRTGFNSLGMPIAIAGLTASQRYTDLVVYDGIGRPLRTELGTNTTGGDEGLILGYAYNDNDGRLQSQQIESGNQVDIGTDIYSYDAAGNPTQIQHDYASNDETECFVYDTRQRLSTARTISGAVTCAGQATGGPAPYSNSYTSNAIHNVTNFDGYTRTFDAASPSSGCNAGTDTAKPHAINVSDNGTVDTDFGFDCNGAITTQVITGGSNAGTTTYSWDRRQRLTGVTAPGGTTSNIYDTTNNRVARVDPDGTRTIYLAGTEVRWTAAGGIDVARTYGQTRREFDGTVTHFATNHQGSIIVANDAGPGHDLLRYEPYGTTRNSFPGATTDLDDRNFLGQIDDPATATVYLNNRHYLPAYGVFTSVDPIMRAGHPETMNAYVYSRGNPVRLSDASGLEPCGLTPEGCSLSDRGGRLPCPHEEALAGDCGELNDDAYEDMRNGGDRGDWRPCTAWWCTALQIAWGAAPYGGELLDGVGCLSGDELSCASVPLPLVSGPLVRAVRWLFGGSSDDAVDAARRIGDDAVDDVVEEGAQGADELVECAAGGNSFVGETRVVLADGTTIAIDDVEIGDVVLAADEQTGEASARRVSDVIIGHGPHNLVTITVDADGERVAVIATDGHPFWVASERRWTDAADLDTGDLLVTQEGQPLEVLSVNEFRAVTTVYNLTVEGVHTYYVGFDDQSALVHNNSCWPVQGPNNDCSACADQIHEMIGGEIVRIEPPEGMERLGYSPNNPRGNWTHHDAVFKDGRYYDSFTGPDGMAAADYLARWTYSDFFQIAPRD